MNEIVLSIAGVVAIGYLTSPMLQLSMTFVLVSDPVCFAFEGFGLPAIKKGTCEGLHVFMDVFRPIRWFEKLFDFETQRAFKLGGETFDRRERDA